MGGTVNIKAAVTRAFDENCSAERAQHRRSWPHTADVLTVLSRSAKHSKRGGGDRGRQTLLPLAARVDVSPHGHNPAEKRKHRARRGGREDQRWRTQLLISLLLLCQAFDFHGIIYASQNENFAQAAAEKAEALQLEMKAILSQ